MPWPDAAPHRLIRALSRVLEAERPLRVLPEVQDSFGRLARAMPEDQREGFDDLARSLSDDGFRRRFLAHREWAAVVRTTFSVTVLRGSEKRNVIPSEASADIDCRLLAGDDADEVIEWIRRVVDDPLVEVEPIKAAKRPNLSPLDTRLYKALADALDRRHPGVVVAPVVLPWYADNWSFRECGLHAYGFSPFVLDEEELKRMHGNDERISLENVRAGVRSYAEMLLAVAGA